MRKTGKRICSLLLAVMMLIGTASALTLGIDAATTAEGMTYGKDLWTMSEALTEQVLTIEAEIAIPTTYEERAGVIVGNWIDWDDASFSFEIKDFTNDNDETILVPRLIFNPDNSKKAQRIDIQFGELDVRTDEGYAHVAVVLDIAGSKATCYMTKTVDGTAVTSSQTVENVDYSVLTSACLSRALCVGTDPRNNSPQYFKGTIKSVALYSDMRTEEEIKADAAAADITAVDTTDAALLAAYDLTATNAMGCADLSSNENHLLFDAGVGLAFEDAFYTPGLLEEKPLTFEAWVYVPTALNEGERSGVIWSNYVNGDLDCISFEITTNGNPRLYYSYDNGKRANCVFDKVDMRTSEWVHLAIVGDGTTFTCYVNGEAKQTLTMDYAIGDVAIGQPFCIGGDLRTSNAKDDFMGRIKEIAIWSDVRTADEVAADMTAVDTAADGLISYYDMRDADAVAEMVEDQGPAGCDMHVRWFNDHTVKDYAYSFAVVGDTQKMTKNDAAKGTDNLAQLYDWIVKNQKSKNIQYVLGLGDIVDTRISSSADVSAAEWELAYEQITKLDGVVEYSLVRGNHDDSSSFNATFGDHQAYLDSIGGYYQDGMLENTWRKIVVCETEYLIFTLDYGAQDDVLAWAGGIIESNPDSRVIITTHAYLFRDGTTLDAGDVVPPTKADKNNNNGDDMWDEFISQYRNIFLVLSGHDPEDDIIMTQTKGVHGNTVTQFLIDPQGMDSAYLSSEGAGTGMVAMFYFSEDGKEVQVEYYSTVRDQYYKATNQFTFDLISDEGNGIVSIEKVSTEELVDTYRITYTNGTTQMITVTNGADGKNGNSPTVSINDDGYWVINGEATTYKATGEDGVAPTITVNSDGYWVINGEATSYKAIGEDGVAPTITVNSDGYWVINGEVTDHKATGEDGITPHVGTNGNWWFGETDTGIHAVGLQGAAGLNGANGADGADGKDGVDGKDGTSTVTYVAMSVAGVALAGDIAMVAWFLLRKKKAV